MTVTPRAAEFLAQALQERAADRRDLALATLARTGETPSVSPRFAHALAQIRLEAGLPATEAFEQALALAPDDPALHLGRAAARFAQGQAEQALAGLSATLVANPQWSDGHAAFARIAVLIGEPERRLETVRTAVARQPRNPLFRLFGIDIALNAEDYRTAHEWAEHAERDLGPAPVWLETRAICCDEHGERAAAATAFAQLGVPDTPERAVRLVRHQLRNGSISDARETIEAFLGKEGDAMLWPYASIVWRLRDPDRAAWLHRTDLLVRSFDLGFGPADLAGLQALLIHLHEGAGQFPDQSVRGGTQTDGPLFARIEPEIIALRARVAEVVSQYRAALPTAERGHPLLGSVPSGPVVFAGSWSVRLRQAGFHAAHHHPQGWLSSAFYAALPSRRYANEGVLELGIPPPDLGIDLPPLAIVVPREGELALFPSWFWHGTTPFAAGERIAVAFDVARS